MRLLDFVLVAGQTPQEKGEITRLNQQKGARAAVCELAGPQPCALEMQLWKAGRGGGDLHALPNALASWLWLNF